MRFDFKKNPRGARSSRLRKQGLTLLELVIALVIIATVLLPLSDMVSRATLSFRQSRETINGQWIANVIMNELSSQEFPSFEGDGTALLSGQGNFREFLENMGQEDLYTDRQLEDFERWEYEWKKEVVLYNKHGGYGPHEDGNEPDFGEDEYQEVTRRGRENESGAVSPEELQELPAARLMRIRLELNVPGQSRDERTEEEEDYDEDDPRSQAAFNPRKITLVSFLDFDSFRPDAEDQDPYQPEQPEPPPAEQPAPDSQNPDENTGEQG